MRDGGYSLIEIAVTITLISIVVVPMLLATTALIRASAVASNSAEGDRAVQDGADRVTRADPACDYLVAVQAAALSRGWPASSASVSYQYFVPNASASVADSGSWSAPGTDAVAACGPTGQRSQRLIQLVTVSMTDEAGVTKKIQVVKSDD